MKWFRWRAIVPTLIVAAIIATLWILFIDRLIRRGIETLGTDLVGAKVELAGARLRLGHGDLALMGLKVTDPDQPMRNLVEAQSIAGAVRLRALFMKKAVIESLAVHGVRFGTARTTSGAVAHPSATSVTLRQRVAEWVRSIPVPTMNLQGLVGTVVNIPAISADSLRSLRQARLMAAQGDSLKKAWDDELRGLDPGPTVDSARALADRLKAADPRRMAPAQVVSTANEVRAMLARTTALKARLDSVQGHVNGGLALVHASSSSLDEARAADVAWVRGLVHLPSFAAPDISKALFGKLVTDRIAPYMYWVQMADRYIPPGLDPRRSSGPTRARMAGTTFHFPVAHGFPDFLLERAAGDLTIGGPSSASGAYQAAITGVTTEPAAYGHPMTFSAGRQSNVGPHDIAVGGSLDRTGPVAHDSVHASVPAVSIPSFALPHTATTVSLGDSSAMELTLARRGNEMNGTWRLSSQGVRWSRGGDSAAPRAAPPLGSAAWAEGLVWNSVASITRVNVEARFSGTLTAPGLSISSNVGDALAANIEHALGAEVRKADAQIRAKVDSMVAAPVAATRARLAGLEAEANQRLAQPRQQLDQVRADLTAELNRLAVVPGLRLPGLPGVPHPDR